MPLAYGLLDPIDLSIPRLPHALERMRLAHLTDLHIIKRSRGLDRMIHQLTQIKLDLGILTGDYMLRNHPHDTVLAYLRELTRVVRPRLGWFGVYGNHDQAELIDQLTQLPVTWLSDEAVALSERPIDIIGLRCTRQHQLPDPLKLAQAVAELPSDAAGSDKRLRLVLSHRPDCLPLVSELRGDLMLSGHTHGGQVRIPPRTALFNSSILPLHLSSGLLRHRDTLAVVSRGLGNTGLLDTPLRLRLFCPPHAPLITLRRGALPGEHADDIHRIGAW